MATVITNKGKEVLTGRLLSNASALGLYIGWGTGTGTAAATDTTLFTEASEARVAATVTQVDTTTSKDTINVVGQLVALANKVITNVGVFDADTGGNLIMKGDFGGLNLAAGDSITFTLKMQVT